MPALPGRQALQGHEPAAAKKTAGGVAGNDYEDEHEAFAASRSSDYIYEAGSDHPFEALDSHAETIEGDVKFPLVITGSTGCGKSALLANWVNRYRLESGLKEHFQLREMEVPTSEERLRWSLNRFLAAAAKKQFPARIVIVLDAVNRLRGESSAADTLHWLPTELPQGVRIIVSTVELEHLAQQADTDLFDIEGSRVHRTYTELRRRKCPTIRLQPLSVEVRHLIINSFLDVNQRALQALEQAQQFRLVTAKASSQPLFLRTILYALRLGFELNSDQTIDDQIDVCLAAETSPQLIARVLELCSEYVNNATVVETTAARPSALSPKNNKNKKKKKVVDDDDEARLFREEGVGKGGGGLLLAYEQDDSDDDSSDRPNVLARVLTALYASRHGVSDAEIWGVVELGTGDGLAPEQRECIRRVLRDFTFSVNGLRNFSHEDYATVVYQEHISTPAVHVRCHQLMARYFGKLAPCDRKLEALPYHLEVAGSWTRLKAALVDVRMFQLWWTPQHKTEFLQLWASLTACSNPGTPIRKLVTGEFDETMRCNQPSRPCLDLVEEYVRAVDDYKFQGQSSDDSLARVILHVADFLLEFATLSLEEPADVPHFVHPAIPNEDLASLGVPFLSRDKDGNSVLNSPFVDNAANKAPTTTTTTTTTKAMMDVPMKKGVHEEVPLCSTYFYHRWMWIQFPLVALANCGEKFLKGLQTSTHLASASSSTASRPNTNNNTIPQRYHLAAGPSTTSSSGEGPPRPLDVASLDHHHYHHHHNNNKGVLLPEILPLDASASNECVPGALAAAAVARSVTRGKKSTTRALQSTTPKPSQQQPQVDEFVDHFAGKVVQLRDTISSYRSELDQLRQEKVQLERVFGRTTDERRELSKIQHSTSDLEARIDHLVLRLEQTQRGHKMARLLYKNYDCVKLMCERHPAHSQALIEELEAKLKQDVVFIAEVKQWLRENAFESHDVVARNKVLLNAARDMTVLQNDMLMQRIRQRDHLHDAAHKLVAAEQAGAKPSTSLLALGGHNNNNNNNPASDQPTAAAANHHPSNNNNNNNNNNNAALAMPGDLFPANKGANAAATSSNGSLGGGGGGGPPTTHPPPKVGGPRHESALEKNNPAAALFGGGAAMMMTDPLGAVHLHKESTTLVEVTQEWEERADFIRKRTFITDVKEFFGKFYNAQTLQSQMRALHNAAELRQRELKNALAHVEAELEQVCYESQSILGSNSREARELQTRLAAQLARHKHAREAALAAERLRQAAFGGVKHVTTTLGIPPPDLDTPINEIIHQVESVLEALMEEKDKSAQKMGDTSQSNTFRDGGYDKLMRAPELEAALEQFETPKALIAHRLPGVHNDGTTNNNPFVDHNNPGTTTAMTKDDDDDGGGGGAPPPLSSATHPAGHHSHTTRGGTSSHPPGTGLGAHHPRGARKYNSDAVLSRVDVKRVALKTLRAEQRRLAKLSGKKIT